MLELPFDGSRMRSVQKNVLTLEGAPCGLAELRIVPHINRLGGISALAGSLSQIHLQVHLTS